MNEQTSDDETARRDARRFKAGPAIIAIAGVGAIYRLVIAWSPIEWLLRHALPDDAFYYFTIARRFNESGILSFDGLSATNGFHPLWMGLLLPLFALVHDPLTAVHAALTLCAVIDTATIIMLYLFCREQGVREGGALTAAAIYALSAAVMNHGGPINGMETALNVLLTLLLLRSTARAWRNGFAGTRGALMYGLLCGLLFLARTDNAIIILVLSTALLFRMPGTLRDRARALAMSGAACVLLAAPWLIWCTVAFGSPVQVSGRSFALVARETFAGFGWGPIEYGVQFVKNIADVARYVPLPFIFTSKASPAFWVIAVVTAVALTVRAMKRKRGGAGGRIFDGLTIAVLIAMVLFFGVHTARTVMMRAWYYYAFVPFLFLLFARLIDPAFARYRDTGGRTRSGRRYFVAVLAVAALLAASAVGWFNAAGLSGRDGDKYTVVQKMNTMMSQGTRIGAWNAGVYGYFYTRGAVVNLDGVVNNAACDAIAGHRLARYADSMGIGHLADDVSTMRAIAPYWGARAPREDSTLYALPLEGTGDTTVIVRFRYERR